MKIAIMQPYFLAYLGYFQLINAADEFVLYDNIEFTKKGWINRNRILLNGKETLFTLPLARSSDYVNVNQKAISGTYELERKRILGQIRSAYGKAPHFREVFPILESIFSCVDRNLFGFILQSIHKVLAYLEIDTPIIISSSLPIDHGLKGIDKVLSICRYLSANVYVNPIGGTRLYPAQVFEEFGIELQFLRMNVSPYPQASDNFISHLSIIDVLMNNSRDEVTEMLNNYELAKSPAFQLPE